MTTSGEYTFQPTAGELTLAALQRCGVKRTQITAEHLADAATESNLLQVEWSARQPNLWKAETYEIVLTPSDPTYTLPPRMLEIMSAYISTEDNGVVTDRVIVPMSTSDYHGIPVKLIEGVPTAYWYDLQVARQITLYPVPDNNATYTLKLRILSQMQDAVLKNGTHVDIPYRWLDAWTAGLAKRLSVIYAADKYALLNTQAVRAWNIAAKQDQEDVQIRITPVLDCYFR